MKYPQSALTIYLIAITLLFVACSSVQGKTKEACDLPSSWAAGMILYIGPGAVNCPYNNSMVRGAVAYDFHHQAVRFDVEKGGRGPHSSWAFYDKSVRGPVI